MSSVGIVTFVFVISGDKVHSKTAKPLIMMFTLLNAYYAFSSTLDQIFYKPINEKMEIALTKYFKNGF